MMGIVPGKHMGPYLKPTYHCLASNFMASGSHAHKEEFCGLGFVIKGCKLQKNCMCLLCTECPDHSGSEFPFFPSLILSSHWAEMAVKGGPFQSYGF